MNSSYTTKIEMIKNADLTENMRITVENDNFNVISVRRFYSVLRGEHVSKEVSEMIVDIEIIISALE